MLKEKKILVTGANGFIGSHLVSILAKSGYEVWAMIRPGKLPYFEYENELIKVVYGDLTEKKSLLKLVPSGGTVINLAVNPSDKRLSVEVNIKGLKNLTEAAKEKKVRKFIQISSQAVKINKKGRYAKTKLEGEDIVKNAGINWVILRPSLVYGEGEKGLFNKIKALAQKLKIVPVFGNGKSLVYPVKIEELCQIILKSIQSKKDLGKIVDVGSSPGVSYLEMYRMVAGEGVRILHLPVILGKLMGSIFELLRFKNPPFSIDNVLGSTQKIGCDGKDSEKYYGIKISQFKTGLTSYGNNKKKVAVIGLGKMGLVHTTILSSIPDVKIVALIDTNKSLYSTIKSYGIAGKFYTSYEEARSKDKFDYVFILTPTWTHASLMKKALTDEKAVFVEKPALKNKIEVEEINKLLKGKDVNLKIGYTLLSRRVIRKFKEELGSGRYGKVIKVEGGFKHGEVLAKKNGWMFKKGMSGGGVIMNPGPHLIAVVNYLFGKPQKIRANLKKLYSDEVEDEAKLLFDYDDFEADIKLSWSVKGCDVARYEIKVFMEKATIFCDGNYLSILKNGKEIRIDEEDLKPILEISCFDINPGIYGEAFFVEDYEFLFNKKKEKSRDILSVEEILSEIYQETACE